MSSGFLYGQPPKPNAVRLTKYILGVSDLDRSYAFYHALGLDFENASAKLAKPNTLADTLLKLVDVPPGSKFRNMMLKAPGGPVPLEVTEFSNLDLHPVKPRLQDPGAALIVLQVPDLSAALAAAKNNGAQVLQPTGVITIRDPDGYHIQFEKGPVTSLRFASVVQNAGTAAGFYHAQFGLEAKVNAWIPAPGRPNTQSRSAEAAFPGATVALVFAEFKGVNRKPYTPRIPDPGAPALGLEVRNIDAAVAAIKAAGGVSITQGGSVKLGSSKVGFVRDPSGVLIELTQR